MTLQQVADRFPGGRWTQGGNEYTVRCPCHKDDKASLGIGVGDKGGVVMNCGAGCDKGAILATVDLTLADLMPTNGNGNHRAEIVSSYRYDDEQGNLVATKHRKSDKSFLWQNAEGGWTTRGLALPLFGLPDLLRSKPGQVVCIAEGEKDVLSLRKMGVIATCNPHGASKSEQPKWTQADTDWIATHLPERKFIIFADNDEAGHRHAEVIYHALQHAGLDARYAQMEGLGKGEDITDWIGRHTTAEFQALLEGPQEKARFPLITFAELCALPPPQWQVEDFFLEQSLVQTYGETGNGKSLLLWDLTCTVCAGLETWFGREINKHGPVVWINADGGLGLTLRANAWAEAHGGEMKHPLLILMGSVHLNREDEINAFRRQIMAMDRPPVMVFFDTQSRCMTGGRENDADAMTAMTEGLHLLKAEAKCSVIPIHHTDKTGQWERGSGVVKNESDTQIRVSKDEDSGIFTVKCKKARDHPPFEDFYFKARAVLDSVVIDQHNAPPPKTPLEEKLDRMDHALLYVREMPGRTCEQLGGFLNVSKRTAERYAEALEAKGLIFRKEIPKAGWGRPEVGLYSHPAANSDN